MADSKITALTAISTVDPTADPLVIVDVSDTSMAASGTTKKSTINQLLGSGGTATLASATITGAATVGTTLGVTGASTLASVGVTGAATVGTTLLVGTNATLTNGNLILGTSGKGIDFSATADGSGTMTSELLNDYEEGTFTATLKGGTTDPTIAVTATGKYTKIGRQVFVRIQFGNASTVGASGAISVTGLPFTSASGDDQVGYLMVENMATFTNSSLSSYLPPSSSTLSFYTSTSNSVITAITHNAGVARYLWATITYNV